RRAVERPAGAAGPLARREQRSAVEDGDVETLETLGVSEDVDPGDPSAANGEPGDGERAPVAEADGARGAVDQRGPHVEAELAERHGAPGDGLRALDDASDTRPAVCPEDDLRVEDCDQPFEVSLAGGGHEGVDHLALCRQVGVGWRRGTPDTAAGA